MRRVLKGFEYFEAQTVDEAVRILSTHGTKARVLAGGTDLLVSMKTGGISPQYVVYINAIPDLDYIQYDEKDGLKMGALATHAAIANSPITRDKFELLATTCNTIGSPIVRNTGTIGGNLSLDTTCIYYNQSYSWRQAYAPCFKRGGNVCHAVKGSNRCHAVCQADLAPVLLALEAKVKLTQSGGERVIPISEFFTGKGDNPNVLEPNEIITEIQLPPPLENSARSYQDFRIRNAIDFSLAGVVVTLNMDGDKICRKAKVVLGSIASAPLEVSEAESILQGERVDDSLLEKAAEAVFKAAHPVANLTVDANYRKKMTRVLLKRAVNQALRQ